MPKLFDSVRDYYVTTKEHYLHLLHRATAISFGEDRAKLQDSVIQELGSGNFKKAYALASEEVKQIHQELDKDLPHFEAYLKTKFKDEIAATKDWPHFKAYAQKAYHEGLDALNEQMPPVMPGKKPAKPVQK